MFNWLKRDKPVEKRSGYRGSHIVTGWGEGELIGEDYDILSLPAANMAIEVISSSIAALELKCKNQNVARVLANPNPEQTQYELILMVMRSLLENGNGYIESGYGANGQLSMLKAHHYNQVSVHRLAQSLRYQTQDYYGNVDHLLPSNMAHIKHNSEDRVFGVSRADELRRNINAAINMVVHAKSYSANGMRPSGVLETENTFQSEDSIARLRQELAVAHEGANRSGKTLVLENGLKFKSTSNSMLENDYVKLYELICVEEVSRIFSIPPAVINDLRYGTYTNSVEQNRSFLQRTLRPWLTLVEQCLNQHLGLTGDNRIWFDTDTLTKLNQDERYASYASAISAGWLTADEVREKEGLAPLAEPVAVEGSENEAT